jgi:hypothetical protein
VPWKKKEIILRLNVWFSRKGVEANPLFGQFPYEAMAPTQKKKIVFENESDLFKELERVYDDALAEPERKYTVGEALFTEFKWFCDPVQFIDRQSQEIIQMFRYCKLTNSPPYPSIAQTPCYIYDSFIIIGQENGS